jgi:hypothetical protein
MDLHRDLRKKKKKNKIADNALAPRLREQSCKKNDGHDQGQNPGSVKE